MKLELHKRYLDRRGKLWVMTGHVPGIAYPWYGKDQYGVGESFTESGSWSATYRYPYDLVSQYVEPVVVEDAPTTEPLPDAEAVPNA